MNESLFCYESLCFSRDNTLDFNENHYHLHFVSFVNLIFEEGGLLGIDHHDNE